MALPRLHATTVDFAHELINGDFGTKVKAGKIIQINKRGVLNKVGKNRGGKKQNN